MTRPIAPGGAWNNAKKQPMTDSKITPQQTLFSSGM